MFVYISYDLHFIDILCFRNDATKLIILDFSHPQLTFFKNHRAVQSI